VTPVVFPDQDYNAGYNSQRQLMDDVSIDVAPGFDGKPG